MQTLVGTNVTRTLLALLGSLIVIGAPAASAEEPPAECAVGDPHEDGETGDPHEAGETGNPHDCDPQGAPPGDDGSGEDEPPVEEPDECDTAMACFGADAGIIGFECTINDLERGHCESA
jgi:hypothetical protein